MVRLLQFTLVLCCAFALVCIGIVVAPNRASDELPVAIEQVVLIQNDATRCTGFIVARGLVATAGHCIRPNDYVQNVHFTDGTIKPFKIAMYLNREDCHRDWALIMVDTGKRLPLQLARPPKIGSRVARVGYPNGLSPQILKIGWLIENDNAHVEMTKIAIHGESGSPLLDRNGDAFGIVTCYNPDNIGATGARITALTAAIAQLQRGVR